MKQTVLAIAPVMIMKRAASVGFCFFALLFFDTYSVASDLSGKYVGKGEGNENELNIQDLGNGTIKFSVSTVSTFTDGMGSRCTGDIPIDDTDATASIKGNTATYTDADGCTLRITFKGKKAVVKENGCFAYHGANCNFNATYLKKR